VTFSAPKSVSILAVATGDERLLAAHDRSVQKALDFLEREVMTSRRGKGGTEIEHTGSMIAATYRHEDARGVNGHIDMQLHTHSILANATRRGDGAWAAMNLSFGTHNVLMHTADAVYKSELALELKKLGYPIRRTASGFESAAITDEQIKAFSGRKAQIDKALAQRGLSRETASAHERTAANLATREDKKQTDHVDQKWAWREEARAAGIDLDRPLVRERAQADLSHEAVKFGVRHLSERETVFGKDQLRLESLKAGIGNTDLQGIEREIAQKSGGLIDVGGGKLTTRDALHREQHILQRARGGQGKVEALMTPEQAQEYITQRERGQGFPFSQGQRTALALALTSRNQTLSIVGAAGAGKTVSMTAVVAAARGQGMEVIGIAPSAAASHELQRVGADDTRTLASLLASRQTDRPGPCLYILDEAGMVSGRDMDALMHRIESGNARLLVVGDPRQLAAVEAGSPFRQMLETKAIQSAAIDEIQRQRDPALREIAQAFARGEAGRATELARPYMQEVRVEVAGGRPTAVEKRAALAAAVVADYLGRDRATRDSTLVLSGTNALRAEINTRIRAGLQGEGLVSRAGVAVNALHKAGLTREQQAHAESYLLGMVVRLEKGQGRERHSAEYRVQKVLAGRVALRATDGTERTWDPARERPAGVYQPRSMELAVGDEIVFRENQRGVDRIQNGESATIVRVDEGKPVARLERGKEVILDPRRGQTIDYGWCRTIHAAQGRTVDHVVVAGEAARVATAQSGYVAATRERDTLTIFTDSASILEERWARWAERQHAIDAAGAHDTLDLDRLTELRSQAASDFGRIGDLSKARDSAEHYEQRQEQRHNGHDVGDREREIER
jgi:conjugative relaxase-like TrwC/TraI family protein